ncbi:hypothetical protein MXB_3941 [Myxobolus squamalis]|nr:hypothetical protein MXB_3941 [Myxobolus squamalis]
MVNLKIYLLFIILVKIWLFAKSSTYYDANKAYKVFQEWNENDPDYDPKDDDIDEDSRKTLEDRRNAGIQPRMAVIHMNPDVDYQKTDKISRIWEIKLTNMHIPVHGQQQNCYTFNE